MKRKQGTGATGCQAGSNSPLRASPDGERQTVVLVGIPDHTAGPARSTSIKPISDVTLVLLLFYPFFMRGGAPLAHDSLLANPLDTHSLSVFSPQRRAWNRGSPAVSSFVMQLAHRTRRRNKSNRARPYLLRLINLRRLTCPSTGPLLEGKVNPA